MQRMLLLTGFCAMLAGCGLTETGAAAAGGSAAEAQQAAQAREKQQHLKQQLEQLNQQAADRQRDSADAASK
jgi:hypothetical protein